MFDPIDKNDKHTDSDILNQSIQYNRTLLIKIKKYTDSTILNQSIQYVELYWIN